MGRKRLLAFGTTSLINGQFATFSFGPFQGAIRILSMWLDLGSTTQQNGSIGLFVANSPDTPSGAVANPAAIPSGWTTLYDYSLFDGGSVVDQELPKFPFGTTSDGASYALANAPMDVVATQFWLKVWVNNRLGVACDPKGFIWIDDAPADLLGGGVDVRPQPGGQPPAGSPPPAPPPPAPTVPTPGPPPAPPGVSALPRPEDAGIPPTRIDPQRPIDSSREQCQ
jgi:hypothetical protein